MAFSIFFIPLVLLISMPSHKSMHDFYVSMSELEYNEESQKFELSCRIFKDDLELAINHTHSPHGVIVDDQMNRHLVQTYLKDKIDFKVDQVEQGLDFIFFALDGSAPTETVFLIFHTKNNFGAFKHLSFSNSILFEIYDDQINMIRIKIDGQRKSKNLEQGDDIFEYFPK
jgi:hypothetical protein